MPEDRTEMPAGESFPSAPPDRAVGRLAARQHGVVSRRQLAALGVTPSMVAVRLEAGRLVRLHRGVFAVGHARLTREGEWLAAVLATGDGALLSHRSAAALHRLLPERGRRVDVATAAKRASTNWIEVHGRQALTLADATRRGAMPVTTVARTLVDLASVVPRDDLERAVNEADVLGTLQLAAVESALGRTCGRRGGGHAALRGVLLAHDGPQRLRSELERAFRRLVTAHDLPRPAHNARTCGWEVDALWARERLAVELDSWRFHRTRATWARDRRKERELRAAGYDVRRLTWEDATDHAAATATELRAALER